MKKILKSLVTMELMISLVLNIIQLPIIKISLENGKTIIIVLSLLTFLISMFLIFYLLVKSLKKIENQKNEELLEIKNKNDLEIIKSQVSVFIANNKDNYRIQKRSVFIDIEDEKNWMFLNLSNKFPFTTCQTLKKFIDNHYELITNVGGKPRKFNDGITSSVRTAYKIPELDERSIQLKKFNKILF